MADWASSERSTDRHEVQVDMDAPTSLPDQCYRYRVRTRSGWPVRPWRSGLPYTFSNLNVSRTEIELSHVHALNHPEYFVDSVLSFQEEHPATEWRWYVNPHIKGLITLIAVRRDDPFDLERDYLREIGMGR